jgi:hypothetical protein
MGACFFGATALTALRSVRGRFLLAFWVFCLRIMFDQTNSSVFPYVCAVMKRYKGRQSKARNCI